jgi:DNA polymerase-3 subunit delta
MILKYYEINKINLEYNKFILFYGKNEGLKNDNIKNLLKDKNEILYYDEKDILDNPNKFIEATLSKSLFENEKIIIIKRATDKINNIIDQISFKDIEDLIILINADNLEKKSKLRSLFEKNKKFVSVAFYPDNDQTLSKIAHNFFTKNKILISASNINLIVSRCSGDRHNLVNEIEKIESFCKNNKKVTIEDIHKLTNLIENHSVSELIDNCLVKNKKKIIHILNENNFSNDDCILILRTFLNKLKKILSLALEYKINKNIDDVISKAKPPIFWKDKEITKQQIYKWSPENIKNSIFKVSELELLVKKNMNNSMNLTTNFILDEASN